MLQSILGVIGAAANAALVFGGQVVSLVQALVNQGNQAMSAALQGVASFGAELSQGVAELATWTRDTIYSLTSLVNALTQQLGQVQFQVPERSRQYQLARLAKNTRGVMFEGMLAAPQSRTGRDVPAPATGAPWVVLDSLVSELVAFDADPRHPIRAALDELSGDVAAHQLGKPPTLDPWPDSVKGVPGYEGLTNPTGNDPNARGFLTPSDLQQVQDTTGGGS